MKELKNIRVSCIKGYYIYKIALLFLFVFVFATISPTSHAGPYTTVMKKACPILWESKAWKDRSEFADGKGGDSAFETYISKNFGGLARFWYAMPPMSLWWVSTISGSVTAPNMDFIRPRPVIRPNLNNRSARKSVSPSYADRIAAAAHLKSAHPIITIDPARPHHLVNDPLTVASECLVYLNMETDDILSNSSLPASSEFDASWMAPIITYSGY